MPKFAYLSYKLNWLYQWFLSAGHNSKFDCDLIKNYWMRRYRTNKVSIYVLTLVWVCINWSDQWETLQGCGWNRARDGFLRTWAHICDWTEVIELPQGTTRMRRWWSCALTITGYLTEPIIGMSPDNEQIISICSLSNSVYCF